jgi:branched-chain amino acid transport system permease protein
MDKFGSQSWADVWAFVLLILVLLFRPQGLLGERVADRA